jgi:hypothetical protein
MLTDQRSDIRGPGATVATLLSALLVEDAMEEVTGGC